MVSLGCRRAPYAIVRLNHQRTAESERGRRGAQIARHRLYELRGKKPLFAKCETSSLTCGYDRASPSRLCLSRDVSFGPTSERSTINVCDGSSTLIGCVASVSLNLSVEDISVIECSGLGSIERLTVKRLHLKIRSTAYPVILL